MDRKTLIKEVHTLAYGRLHLTEEEYREVVEGATGQKSVKELLANEIEKVLVALRRFNVGMPGRPPARGERGDRHRNFPHHRSIARLMDYLGWKWESTAKFCERITGKTDTRDCDAAELRKVCLGMVALIEQNLVSGKLVLPPARLAEFRFYNKLHQKAEETS